MESMLVRGTEETTDLVLYGCVDFEIRVLKYSSFDNNGYPIFWLCELLQSSDLVSKDAECVSKLCTQTRWLIFRHMISISIKGIPLQRLKERLNLPKMHPIMSHQSREGTTPPTESYASCITCFASPLSVS